MHTSDILVLGPLPLVGRSLRLPVGAVFAALLMLLLAGAAAAVVTIGPGPMPLSTIEARLPVILPGMAPTPAPVPPGVPVRILSTPPGASIVLDGGVLGTTPATVTIPSKHPLLLRRPGGPDVTVLHPRDDVGVPLWPAPTVLPVRAPMPGGAVSDLQVLANGRLALAVATAATPNQRQVWLLDTVQAHLERIGPASRDDVPPAGVVVAPDGQRRIALMRGTSATPGTPATPDALVLDGPEEHGQQLSPEGMLTPDERVRDLSWAPDTAARHCCSASVRSLEARRSACASCY